MQNRQQQSEPELFGPANGLLNIVAILCSVMSVTVEVFIRRNFGVRYLNWQAAAGILLILIFGSFFPGQDLRVLVIFFVGYIVFLLRARLEGLLRRWRNKPEPHSRYNGESRCKKWFPTWRESTVKTYAEPVAILIFGLLMNEINHVMGVYLMLSSAALFVTGLLSSMYERARELDVYDAMANQRILAERARESHDRFHH